MSCRDDWTRTLTWLRRQPRGVCRGFLLALARFDPPIPALWRRRFEAVSR